MEAFNRHPATTNNAVARRADPWLGVRALGALQVYGADSHHRRPVSLTIYRNAAAFAARARRPRSRRAPGVVIPGGWRETFALEELAPGAEDAVITAVESVLQIMRGGKEPPKPSRLKAGEALVEEADPGDTLFLLLDGA